MKLIYKKAYKYYQCEACKKTYSIRFIDNCIKWEYTPNTNYCMNCGCKWESIEKG